MSTGQSAGGQGGSPFSPMAVLTLLLLGAAAFIAALYFIGAGNPNEAGNDGGAHAAGTGLNGYAAFSELLKRRGYTVSNIRNASRLDDEDLLILTPPTYLDPTELNEVITRHRKVGPVILIMPKWFAATVQRRDVKAKPGWVMLIGANSPDWVEKIGHDKLMKAQLAEPQGKEKPAPVHWAGLGQSGTLPAPEAVQSVASTEFAALVQTPDKRNLVSFWDDGGYYPQLSAAAGIEPYDEDQADSELWPVVVIAEPDLVNNYGLADRSRAMAALAIVDATLEDYDMPIAFDLTFNGYGQSDNLLSLAFRPPFLAATLCFLIAAVVVAWRAFKRFGPPVGGTPGLGMSRRQLAAGGIDATSSISAFAFGKRQLATNGAALIQRAKRLHLLGAPYAAIVRTRTAQALGLRQGSDPAVTEREIDVLLERRGIAPEFAAQAEALRQAKGPHELLRRAHALKMIERKLAR